MADTYQAEQKKKLTLLLREKLKELPPFCAVFFRAIENVTSAQTRVGYACDLRIFFRYLAEECPDFGRKQARDFELPDLVKVTADDLEGFMEYLTYYVVNRDEETFSEYQNGEKGKSRKLSAVRTMFTYFYKRRKIAANPSELIDMPKIHEKNIVTLEVDEIARLLDEVESGEKLTPRQQKFHAYTKSRDVALISLLLGTGMRVSECVGVDTDHLDFGVNGVKVTRKGGNVMVLYFNGEVEDALKIYLLEREKFAAGVKEGDEKALFLSIQHKRITVRAVQLLVKKYARLITTLKTITPHKLRSTFGTQLYMETQDIYLVAEALGHANVDTTRKHYAKMTDEPRRRAARQVHLRK